MTIPSAATKQHLDSSSDDPRQARGELADLVDKFNTLRSHLSSSGITSGSSVLGIGMGLESAGGNLRLSDSGVTAGSYTAASVTVDAKGRVTAVENGAANQSEMETETVGKVADASLMKHSPGVAKGWVNFNGTGTIAIRDSYNVDSISDDGIGRYTVNWDVDFGDVDYSPSVTCGLGISGSRMDAGAYRDNSSPLTNPLTTSATKIAIINHALNNHDDNEYVYVQVWGVQ